MIKVFIAVVLIAAGISLLFKRSMPQAPGRAGAILSNMPFKSIGALFVLLALGLLASTSFVFVDANAVGHLKRIYATKNLPQGRILASSGEKGPQANILGPGFHFIPLLDILYDFEEFPVVTVPEGSYAALTALDGIPMPDGMFIAPAFRREATEKMLSAVHFLANGGIRGPQETVLKPGSYRLNRYLWHVDEKGGGATIIPAGHVGVVKSNVQSQDVDCPAVKLPDAKDAGNLRAPLVPKGCIGIWRSPIYPGAYYLNRRAFDITLVDTRAHAWIYKGGYRRRQIDLTIDQNGRIKQRETSALVKTPANAADRAVFIKVEGWDIPQELRVVVQVTPENASTVVASVGDLKAVENRIITPTIRSVVRNVAGRNITVSEIGPDGTLKTVTRQVRALDLLENRPAIETLIEDTIKREGRKAGIDIKEIRLGEPGIPPELLVSRLRQQLAQQLAKAYEEEKKAQSKRIETELARSTANEQPRLVRADINVQVSKRVKETRRNEGEAERNFLEQMAMGQKAQVSVLGEERVLMLEAMKQVLETLKEKPELVRLIERLVPNTVVTADGGGGLAGAAAIFGSALSSTNNGSNARGRRQR